MPLQNIIGQSGHYAGEFVFAYSCELNEVKQQSLLLTILYIVCAEGNKGVVIGRCPGICGEVDCAWDILVSSSAACVHVATVCSAHPKQTRYLLSNTCKDLTDVASNCLWRWQLNMRPTGEHQTLECRIFDDAEWLQALGHPLHNYSPACLLSTPCTSRPVMAYLRSIVVCCVVRYVIFVFPLRWKCASMYVGFELTVLWTSRQVLPAMD